MDFLKKLTKPTFYLAKYAQGVAHFRCKKSLKVGSEAEGTAILPGGARCDLIIQIAAGQGDAYAGKPVGPPESVTLLEKTFLPDTRELKDQMFYKPNAESFTRHMRTYGVHCRDFHNFKGVTAELSREGALMILTGPVEPGIDIKISLLLDDEDLAPSPMEISATVEWCQQRDEKTWVASLEFKPLTEEQDAVLAKFLADLKYRLPGSRPAAE
jgi:hypothetical protein